MIRRDRAERNLALLLEQPQAFRAAELLSLFAPEATVQLHDDQEPVTGIPALRELYRRAVGRTAESRHVWTTTVLDDGRIEARWVQASRTIDGRMVALSGIEHVTFNPDGLITNLRNRMVAPDNDLTVPQ